MGLITAVGSFFSLTSVINLVLAILVLVQSVPQIVALTVLRRRQPELHRPYRQWLYPLASLTALAGWLYVYASAENSALIGSAIWIVAGVFVYLGWARINNTWPLRTGSGRGGLPRCAAPRRADKRLIPRQPPWRWKLPPFCTGTPGSSSS